MMSNVRIALIGAGGLANSMHYPALTTIEDVEIVGLCDLDETRLNATAQRFGIQQTFTNYQTMLSAVCPDAVYALMPPHILFDVAMDVLESGYHLFVEKPPAVTTFQTVALANTAERKRLVTGVGFQRRYHPMVHACWEEVRKSGDIHQVVSCFYKNSPPSETHPYYRGAIDILHCDAIHAVDALRYYCGLSNVTNVTSEIRTLDCWYAVSFNAIVTFENGVVGVLLSNWRTGRRVFKFEFHAYGASGYADADGAAHVWKNNEDAPSLQTTATDFAGTDKAYVIQGFVAENRAFIDAVKSGTPPHNNLTDTVKTMELADLIYENAVGMESK